MYFDLNVPWSEDRVTNGELAKITETLSNFGYKAIAYNHVVEGKVPTDPCPIKILTASGKDEKLKDNSKKTLRQYKRLTLVLGNVKQNYGINTNNSVLSSYDLLAVQPMNEKMFTIACTSLDIDIISLCLHEGRLLWPLKRGLIKQACQRGISFEINYSPMLTDASQRRTMIGNARSLTRYFVDGGLFVSGGCDCAWQVRGAFDISNLMSMTGMKRGLRQQCMSGSAKKVVMHAGTRKHTFRAAISIISNPLSGSKEVSMDEDSVEPDHMQEDFVEFK